MLVQKERAHSLYTIIVLIQVNLTSYIQQQSKKLMCFCSYDCWNSNRYCTKCKLNGTDRKVTNRILTGEKRSQRNAYQISLVFSCVSLNNCQAALTAKHLSFICSQADYLFCSRRTFKLLMQDIPCKRSDTKAGVLSMSATSASPYEGSCAPPWRTTSQKPYFFHTATKRSVRPHLLLNNCASVKTMDAGACVLQNSVKAFSPQNNRKTERNINFYWLLLYTHAGTELLCPRTRKVFRL